MEVDEGQREKGEGRGKTEGIWREGIRRRGKEGEEGIWKEGWRWKRRRGKVGKDR